MNGNTDITTTLIVAPDTEPYPELVQQIGPHSRIDFAEWTTNSSEAIRRTREIQPAVVLLDSDTPGVDCFDLAIRLQSFDFPVAAIIVSASKDPQSFRRAIQAGVQEYLIKPVSAREMAQAILEVSQSFRKKVSQAKPSIEEECEVVALVSARGGAGKSTIGVNVAVVLAQELQKRSALIEMSFGAPAMMMGLTPQSGLVDLSYAMHEADLEMLKTYSMRHGSGVDVYVAYSKPDFVNYQHVNGDFNSRVTTVLRGGYDFVLTEYPLLAGQGLAVLDQADQILVVTNGLELVSLRETRGLVNAICGVVSEDRIRIIVNRWEPRGFISEKDVERTLGRSVWAYLVNDERTVLHSINIGNPVVSERPTAPLSLQLKSLARRIAGIPAEGGEAKKRFRLLGLG